MEELAPTGLALPGDPVGLQLGHPGAQVDRILVALDLDENTLGEAKEIKASMIITHHPLIFEPLTSLDESKAHQDLIAGALRSNINVYSAHTNLDISPRGLGKHLADILGLAVEGRQVIEVTGRDQLFKLVVFVPAGHEDALRQALSESGAGWIGNYSHCTFQSLGEGTFMPREGTDPFIGSYGKLEKVEELRLETIVPASLRRVALEALLAAHPYEEAAYDIYPLENRGAALGLGLVGELEEPVSLKRLLQRCSEKLGLGGLRYLDPGKKILKRVAVCPGSGGSLLEKAASLGAEIFISGDFRHHDLKKASGLGLGLIDAGHYGTERPVVDLIGAYLQKRLEKDDFTAEIIAAPGGGDWVYL